jgi:hypothetical protein
VGDLPGRVLGGHDLALVGQLDASVDRARPLGEDRDVRRPAAAAERPATPVKKTKRTPRVCSRSASALCAWWTPHMEAR